MFNNQSGSDADKLTWIALDLTLPCLYFDVEYHLHHLSGM